MFCKNCGKEIMENAVVCPNCGCATGNTLPKTAEVDSKSVGFGILSFFFPVVGLILFLVWKDTMPMKAKSAGIGALVGVAGNILFGILYAAVFTSLLTSTIGFIR